MNKDNAKLLVFLAAIVYLFVIWIAHLSPEKYQAKIAGGIAIPFIIDMVTDLLQNIKTVKTYLLSKTIYRGYEVRFSVAYLFNIKVENEYLLIYNARRQHFQPVGGVYKKFPEANVKLEELESRPDDQLAGKEEVRKDDLRLFLPMRNSLPFIQWFQSEKDRETAPSREFYEELIRPGILQQKDFLYISFKKRCSITTPIQHLEKNGKKYKQIQVFDVFDLIPDEEQKAALVQLRSTANPSVGWADEQLIKNKGESARGELIMHIGEHTKWTLTPAKR